MFNNKTVQKQVDKFNMTLDINDGGISRVLYTVGARERAFMHLIKETIKPGMVCVDLGANIGYTTLFMLDEVGPDGKVYAIEPDPHNISLLLQNVQNNGFMSRCEIRRCAISDTDGKIDFWIASQPNLNSVKKTKYSIRKEEVTCHTLTNYLKDRRYPNFIKMDVEGHEVKIFEGALEYFTKNEGNTNFLVEVHPHFYDEDNDFAAILKEFFKIGFKGKYAISTPIPQPALFKEAGYEPVAVFNTDGFQRGLYEDLSNEHLLEFSCKPNREGASRKIVRSFMLSR
tara:strand:- start:1172 stop:2026 length:855 start_codon:yes stop_codon:yes gene_type:complete